MSSERVVLEHVQLSRTGAVHILHRLGRTTLCGRRMNGTPPILPVESAKPCTRCRTKNEEELARSDRRAQRWEQAEQKAAANVEGRFVVYRCKLCGVQHFPQSQGGLPFCTIAGHVAELEVLEVQGPGFEAAS